MSTTTTLATLNTTSILENREGDLEKFIKIAADSIDQLRKVDVLRVLESNGSRQKDLAAYITTKRPDLAQEVKEVMEDELGHKDWPVAAMKDFAR